MSSGIRLAEDVDLFVLDDQGVFFSESRQELQLFNGSATFIWCCLAEGRDERETVRAFEEGLGASREEAERHVAQALHRWQGLGYLSGAELPGPEAIGLSAALEYLIANPRLRQELARSPSELARKLAIRNADLGAFLALDPEALERQAELETERKRARRQATPRALPWDEVERASGERLGEASLRHSYQLLTTRVQVRFATPAQERIVHPILAHLEIDAVDGAGPVLEVLPRGSGHIVLADGEPVGRCAALEGLGPLVESHLAQLAIDAHRYFMQIHAGVVSDGEQCTLLTGPRGSGKSTLTAALVQAGFEYLSDEMALLEQGTLHVRALPFGITVKPGATDLLSQWYPHLRELPAHLRNDHQVVRYLVPQRESLPADLDRAYPVRRLVFPRYEPTEPTSLRPIDRARALQRLLEECMALPQQLDAAQVRSLVSWMRTVACFRLVMSDLHEAVDLLRRSR